MSCASVFLLSLFLVGCETAPIKTTLSDLAPVDQQISFDGEEQNAGILDFIPGEGFLVTKKAKERYQALAAIYGPRSSPAVLPSDGVLQYKETDKFILSSEAMVNFQEFTQLHKSGR